MKNKHTPGPWNINYLRNGANILATDGHGAIAKVNVRYSKTNNLIEFEANACLIAAAPELLEALKEALNEKNMSQMPYRIKAYKAIAKAEGRKDK